MNFVLRPWLLLLLILAGWINRDQQDAIEYLLTENQVLREKLGKRRILLNDGCFFREVLLRAEDFRPKAA